MEVQNYISQQGQNRLNITTKGTRKGSDAFAFSFKEPCVLLVLLFHINTDISVRLHDVTVPHPFLYNGDRNALGCHYTGECPSQGMEAYKVPFGLRDGLSADIQCNRLVHAYGLTDVL